MRFFCLRCTIGLALAACARPGTDPRVDGIVQRAVAAASALQRFQAEMQQVDIAPLPGGVDQLTPEQQKQYATFVRRPQPDGSTVLYDRVDGHYEFAAPSNQWMVLRRVGGDGHINISMSDDTSTLGFLTRFPDSITRTVTPASSAAPAFSIVAHFARELFEETKRAAASSYRGREITQGVLCDVIELELPGGASEAPFVADSDTARNRYYIGVSDGLIRRIAASSGAADGSGRANYRDVLLAVDPSSELPDLSWERFARAVQDALGSRQLPRVVTTR